MYCLIMNTWASFRGKLVVKHAIKGIICNGGGTDDFVIDICVSNGG